MIGIDPHKASHTAVALDRDETKLGQIRVRASTAQVTHLRSWAMLWTERVWAIEGATGLGRLLAQQLLAVGEHVLDVQPKLAARVRLLNTGTLNKNDPNDARSVAVAAMRSPDIRAAVVAPEDHASVMKVWVRRHRDLSRTRNRIVCRLHAVLCDLVAGGFPKQISAPQAALMLAAIVPVDAVGEARLELAHELLEDLRRVDEQRRAAKRRLSSIVAASGTTVSQVYGAGPVVTATVIGDVGAIARFPTRDHFAAYNGTAPIEASSGNRTIHRLSRRGNRHLNHATHMAAVSQISHHDTTGRDYYRRKIDEDMPPKSALRSLKRKISDALYARMIADALRTARRVDESGPGGQTGNDSDSSATGSHPEPALRKSHSRTATNSKSSRAYKPSSAPTKARQRTT
ncbi:MAG: IS110 family transposase [Pseudonocardiales bacterium]|nr:MAG: IS110 family transposase [Pseudonocardiales bacterium]